jgi:hypothetical protein
LLVIVGLGKATAKSTTMTTFYQENLTCQNCGKTSGHHRLRSTNQFGSSDLDARPPEMARSTLHVQDQVCPDCKYCAVDISKPAADASGYVSSEAYHKQFNSSEYPALANAFLCNALTQESTRKFDTAGWASIKAAWVCDDAKNNAGSKKCRIRTVELFRKAPSVGQEFAGQPGADDVTLVDLLRRSEQFEDATRQIELGLSKCPEEIIRKILEFERDLIAKRDVGCHTVGDVPGVCQNRMSKWDIKIISGGQTGADHAGLDWAMKHSIPRGGWYPKGRRAADGPIDAKDQLQKSPSSNADPR